MTGIPCVHAYACIDRNRNRLENFVHEYYSKARYLATYSPIVNPLPGPKQWEKTEYPEPEPPKVRKMPGRPLKKKRRKEPGEAQERQVKRGKTPNKCSNCGTLGHNRKTCKNPPVAPSTAPKPKGGRPLIDDPWAAARKEGQRKRKKTTQRPGGAGARVGTSDGVATSAGVGSGAAQASGTSAMQQTISLGSSQPSQSQSQVQSSSSIV